MQPHHCMTQNKISHLIQPKHLFKTHFLVNHPHKYAHKRHYRPDSNCMQTLLFLPELQRVLLQSVIFWNHCQLLFPLAFCIWHHSASFYPWSDIFGTTKVSDRSSEISAFQTIIRPKMIWTLGTMSVCLTMKSEIGHWIYKQAKHSCWKWSIKPYAWLFVRWTVSSF